MMGNPQQARMVGEHGTTKTVPGVSNGLYITLCLGVFRGFIRCTLDPSTFYIKIAGRVGTE